MSLKQLINAARKRTYLPQYQASVSDAEVLGKIVASYLKWEPEDIITAISSALEDANMHDLNREFTDLTMQEEDTGAETTL